MRFWIVEQLLGSECVRGECSTPLMRWRRKRWCVSLSGLQEESVALGKPRQLILPAEEVWDRRLREKAKVYPATGRLRLNLNPSNLVRWIDSWPFDKTWKPGWNDSTWVNWFNGRAMNLAWIFIMIPSCARTSFSKASPYFFITFVRTKYGYGGDRFNAVWLFRVISEDSAERDSLDEY